MDTPDDPRRDLHAWLDHDDFLRALARGLIADASRADDVVQQAYVHALATPRTGDAAALPIRSLRNWLAGVVRHLAAKSARSEARRARHERAGARGEATPSVAEIVAREETRRRVVAAVLRLDEPMRSAIVLRYFEKLPPRVIARRLELPVETVRTRIKRALERLRAELDAAHDGRRGEWLALLAPFTLAPPLMPLAASATALVGALTHLSIGVVVMSTKAKLATAAGITAAVALGWYAFFAMEPLDPPPRRVADATDFTLPAPVDAGEGESAPLVAVTPDRTPMAAPAWSAAQGEPPPAAPLFGTVIVAARRADGSPAAGATISLYVWSRPDPYKELSTATADAAGAARFDEVEPGKLSALGDVAGHATGSVEAGATTTLALQFPPGFDVVGSVVDPAGKPVGGAAIWLAFDGGTWEDGSVVAFSDGSGRFTIEGVTGARNVGARARGFAPSRLQWARGADGSTVEVAIAFEERGGRVAGVVVDDAGAPVAGAIVQLGDEQKRVRSPATARFQTIGALLLRARSDADGAFAFDGTPLGELPIVARADGFAPTTTRVVVDEHSVAEVEIELLGGAIVEGTARDGAGEPVAGANVVLAGDSIYAANFGACTRTSGTDGSFRFDHAPVGAIDARASREGDASMSAARLELRDGETTRWDPLLGAGKTLRLRVVAPDGAPLPGFLIDVTGKRDGAPGEWFFAQAESDADGRVALAGCPAGPLRVSVLSRDRMALLRLFEAFRAGGEEELVAVDPALLPSARLSGRVVGADGLPIANASISWTARTMPASRPVFSAAADGRFDIGPFVPGDVELLVNAAGHARTTTPVPDLAAEEVRDLGDLRVERGVPLVVSVRDESGGAVDLAYLDLRRTDASGFERLVREGDAFRCDALPCGEWEVAVAAAGFAPRLAPLRAAAGTPIELDLRLARGVVVGLRWQLSAELSARLAAGSEAATLLVRAAEGEGVARLRPDRDGFRPQEWTLEPGRYVAELTFAGSIAATETFEVAAGAGAIEVAFE